MEKTKQKNSDDFKKSLEFHKKFGVVFMELVKKEMPNTQSVISSAYTHFFNVFLNAGISLKGFNDILRNLQIEYEKHQNSSDLTDITVIQDCTDIALT